MPLRGEGGAQERPDPRGGGRILQEARAGAFQGLPASLHPSSSNTALPLASYSPLSDPYSISAFLTSGFKVHGNGAWGICRATLSSGKQRLPWKLFIPSQTCSLFSLPQRSIPHLPPHRGRADQVGCNSTDGLLWIQTCLYKSIPCMLPT